MWIINNTRGACLGVHWHACQIEREYRMNLNPVDRGRISEEANVKFIKMVKKNLVSLFIQFSWNISSFQAGVKWNFCHFITNCKESERNSYGIHLMNFFISFLVIAADWAIQWTSYITFCRTISRCIVRISFICCYEIILNFYINFDDEAFCAVSNNKMVFKCTTYCFLLLHQCCEWNYFCLENNIERLKLKK